MRSKNKTAAMADVAGDEALGWALRCFALHMEATEARMRLAEAGNPVIELPGSLRLLYTFCDDLMLNVGPLLPMLMFEQNRGEILSNVTPPAHLSEACVRALYEVVFDGSMPPVGSDISATAPPRVCDFSTAQAKFGPFFAALSTLPLAKLRLALENAPESDCGGYFVNGMAVDMDALERCIADRTRFLPFVRRVYALTNATALNQPDRRTILGEKTTNFVESVSALLKTKQPKRFPSARSPTLADAAPLVAATKVKTAFVALLVALDADFEAGGRPVPAFSSMYSQTAFSEKRFSSAMQASSTGFGLFSAFGINEALVLGPAAEHALALFLEQRSDGLVPVRPLCSSALFEHILSDKKHQKSKIGKYLQKVRPLWESRIKPKLAKWEVGAQDLVSECLLNCATNFMCHPKMSGPALVMLQAQVDIWLGLRTAQPTVGRRSLIDHTNPTPITATASDLSASDIGWGAFWVMAYTLIAGLSTLTITVKSFREVHGEMDPRSKQKVLELMVVVSAIMVFSYVIMNSNFETDDRVNPHLGFMPNWKWLNNFLNNRVVTKSYAIVKSGSETLGIAVRNNISTINHLFELFFVAGFSTFVRLWKKLGVSSEEEKIDEASSRMPNFPLTMLLTMLVRDVTPVETGEDLIDYSANAATTIVAGLNGVNSSTAYGIFTSAALGFGRWLAQRNYSAQKHVEILYDISTETSNLAQTVLGQGFELDIVKYAPSVCAVITVMAFAFSKLAVQFKSTRKWGVRLDRLYKNMSVLTQTVTIASLIVLFTVDNDLSASVTRVKPDPIFENKGVSPALRTGTPQEDMSLRELYRNGTAGPITWNRLVSNLGHKVEDAFANAQDYANSLMSGAPRVRDAFTNVTTWQDGPPDRFLQFYDGGYVSAAGSNAEFTLFEKLWISGNPLKQTPKDMISQMGILNSALILSKYLLPIIRSYSKSTLETSESDEDQKDLFAVLKRRVRERIERVAIRENFEDPNAFSSVVRKVIEHGKSKIKNKQDRNNGRFIDDFQSSSQLVIQRIIDRYDLDSLITLLQRRCKVSGAAYLAECIRIRGEKRVEQFANEPQIVLSVLGEECQGYYAEMMLVILERILDIKKTGEIRAFDPQLVVDDASKTIMQFGVEKLANSALKTELNLTSFAQELLNINEFSPNFVKAGVSSDSEIRVEGTEVITEIGSIYGFRPATLQNAWFFLFSLIHLIEPIKSIAVDLKLEDIQCNLQQFYPLYHMPANAPLIIESLKFPGTFVGPMWPHVRGECFPKAGLLDNSDSAIDFHLRFLLFTPPLIFLLTYLGNKGERSLRS